MSLTQNKYFWLAVGLYVFYLLGGWRVLDPVFDVFNAVVDPWINTEATAEYWAEEERRKARRKELNKRFNSLLDTSTLSTSEKVLKRLKMPFWSYEELTEQVKILETLQGHF